MTKHSNTNRYPPLTGTVLLRQLCARKTQEHPQCPTSTDPENRGIGYTNLSKNLHDLKQNVSLPSPTKRSSQIIQLDYKYWLSLSTVHQVTSQPVPGNTGCLHLIVLTMH